MFKTIRESLKITNGNIVIATPLIFFSLIASLYMIFSSTGNSVSLIFSVVLFFLMLGAFFSGWFYIIRRAVKEPEIEDSRLITEFPSGVGEYFLPVMGMIFNIIVIFILTGIVVLYAGKKFIGGFGISYSQIIQATSNVEATKAFVESLSPEQLAKINAWNLLALFTGLFTHFIIMLYPAVIFFKEKSYICSQFYKLFYIFNQSLIY